MASHISRKCVLWVAALAYAFLLCTQISFAGESGKACQIPKGICSCIASKYPGWRLLKVGDLSSEDQQLWKAASGENCPGFAEGNFKGAGKKGYFVLLLPRKRQAKTEVFYYKLVYIEPDGHGAYTASEIQKDGPITNSPVIWWASPGELEDIETGKKAKSDSGFLILEYMEEGSRAFYWDGKQFASILYTM